MSVVVDASTVTLWFIGEERSAAALDVLSSGEPLLAPDLLLAEVANAIWLSLRGSRSKTPSQHVRTFLNELPSHIRIISSAPLVTQAFEVARALDNPVYEAVYVALAVRETATLLTFDQRLVRKLRESAYSSILTNE